METLLYMTIAAFEPGKEAPNWITEFNSLDPEEMAENLAKMSVMNNQMAEILTLANEKVNDADWRSKQLVDTF